MGCHQTMVGALIEYLAFPTSTHASANQIAATQLKSANEIVHWGKTKSKSAAYFCGEGKFSIGYFCFDKGPFEASPAECLLYCCCVNLPYWALWRKLILSYRGQREHRWTGKVRALPFDSTLLTTTGPYHVSISSKSPDVIRQSSACD